MSKPRIIKGTLNKKITFFPPNFSEVISVTYHRGKRQVEAEKLCWFNKSIIIMWIHNNKREIGNEIKHVMR